METRTTPPGCAASPPVSTATHAPDREPAPTATPLNITPGLRPVSGSPPLPPTRGTTAVSVQWAVAGQEAGQGAGHRQTFRTIVTGGHNAVAYNAALTAARHPGVVYTPLFITGGEGLGKSHLLRAIAAYLQPRLHGAEAIVVDAEAFAQDFLAHLRGGRLQLFRRRYRRAGALLVDDVTTIAHYATSCEELALTVDDLFWNGRQIVYADQQSPLCMHGVPAALQRRLAVSLIVTIGVPDLATRLRLLRQQTAGAAHRVEDDALVALAAGVTNGSGHDLAVALDRLSILAAERGVSASAALATQVAGEIMQQATARPPRGRVAADDVLHAVCAYYGVSRQMLLSTSRELGVARPRQVAMYLLREVAGLSASDAGRAVGRDHSTVLHGCERIEQMLANPRAPEVRGRPAADVSLAGALDDIREALLQRRHASLSA